MDGLIKGDLINVFVVDKITKAEKKTKAKFLKFNGDKTRLNVLVQGKMAWVDAEKYEGKSDKLDFSNKEKAKEAVKESKGEEKDHFDPEIKGFKDNPLGSKQEKPAKELKTKHGLIFNKIKEVIKKHKRIEISDLSDKTGFHNEQIESAIYSFVKDGSFVREVTEENKIYFSIKEEPKIKTVKKSNEITKYDRIINLVKAGHSHAEIAEILNTSEGYIRDIVLMHMKKMKIPKEGTLKKEIFDLIKLGESVKDVAKKVGKSYTYINKIKRQMSTSNYI